MNTLSSEVPNMSGVIANEAAGAMLATRLPERGLCGASAVCAARAECPQRNDCIPGYHG